MQSKLHLDTDRKNNAFLIKSRLLQVQFGWPSGVQDAFWKPKWRPHCACTSLTKRLLEVKLRLYVTDKGTFGGQERSRRPAWRAKWSPSGAWRPVWRAKLSPSGAWRPAWKDKWNPRCVLEAPMEATLRLYVTGKGTFGVQVALGGRLERPSGGQVALGGQFGGPS